MRTSLVIQMVKNLPAMQEDPDLIPGFGRSPGEWNSYPLQYSCLKNFKDRGACWATVHGATKSQFHSNRVQTLMTYGSIEQFIMDLKSDFMIFN